MAIKSRNTLKSYFETGDKPTQDEYGDLIDSMVHPDEDVTLFGVGIYNPTKLYYVDSYCFFSGNIYICIEQTSGTFDSEKWQKINNKDIVAIVDITHSELLAAISESRLIPGMKYRITDYRTIHIINNTDVINEGGSEPLIVLALSNNVISSQVYSEAYPQDIIHYDINNVLCENETTVRPGWIYYRKDLEKNIACCYDWRSVKYRRYEFDFADLEWDENRVYLFGDICAKDNILYTYIGRSLDSGTPPEGNPDFTMLFTNNYFLTELGEFFTVNGVEANYVLKAKIDSYDDFVTFADTTETGIYENIVIEKAKGISQALPNIVILESAINVKISSENTTYNKLKNYTDIGNAYNLIITGINSQIIKPSNFEDFSDTSLQRNIIVDLFDSTISDNQSIYGCIIGSLTGSKLMGNYLEAVIISILEGSNLNNTSLANCRINTLHNLTLYNQLSNTTVYDVMSGRIEGTVILDCYFSSSSGIYILQSYFASSTLEIYNTTISNSTVDASDGSIGETVMVRGLIHSNIAIGSTEINRVDINGGNTAITRTKMGNLFIEQCETVIVDSHLWGIGGSENTFIYDSNINFEKITLNGSEITESNLYMKKATINDNVWNGVTIVNNIWYIGAIANTTGDDMLLYFDVTTDSLQVTDMLVTIPDGTSAEDAAALIASELETQTSNQLEFTVDSTHVIVTYNKTTPGLGALEVTCTEPEIILTNMVNNQDLCGTIFSANMSDSNLCNATKIYNLNNKEVILTSDNNIKVKSYSDTGITLDDITD